MDAIWRDALDTSDRTVDTHIKTCRQAQGVRDDLDPSSPIAAWLQRGERSAMNIRCAAARLIS